MLIDILSTTSYAQYNVTLAHILGLDSAIYINQLININEKAVRKSTLKEGFIKLKRSYITERTTFTKSKQLQIENSLINAGLIVRDSTDPDLIKIDTEALTSLVMSEDESLIKDISKISKKKSSLKEAKAQEVESNLKECITTDNDELRKAYFDWIDSVLFKHSSLTPKAVIIAQRQVDEFSNRDLDAALGLLEFAAVGGYVYMTNAIKNYRRNNSVANNYMAPAKLNINTQCTEVLGDNIF